MFLYHISQSVNTGYDTYSDAVVVAQSELDAKTIHPADYHTEPVTLEPDEYDAWCAVDRVQVKLIGHALPDMKRGVVCASFHAG